jgi:ABC-type nitrate/sulfonate/bicarbonate transport system substrate-binding protein
MEKLRLGLEWFLNPDHVPFLVGLERGWFEEAGVDLELIEPEEHLDAIDEIEAGRMDVAITEPIHLVADVAEEKPVRGFARFLHTNGGVMYLKGKGIERPRDMAGKRLQYPGAPGPGGPAIIKSMIRADGGDPGAANLTPVNHGFRHTDALIENKADLATLIFYNFEVIEARGKGHDVGYFALKDWGVPDFCQLILIAHPDRLKRDTPLLIKFLDVLGRGIGFVHEHPEEARRIYDARTGAYSGSELGAAIYNATVPCFTYDLGMSRRYYRKLIGWMLKTGQIASRPSARECWTNSLVFDR